MKQNTKGFIQIGALAVIGAIALAGLIGGFVASKSNNSNELRLGAATGSGLFPTSSLNNFQDNDVINAGDWNALERKIGINNSSDPSSLDYQLTASSTAGTIAYKLTTSTDPGHKHTTSSVTGINYIKPIAEGGTATSTIPTNGQLLIGNGTNYSLSTLTAGTSTVITNTTGSIKISTTPVSATVVFTTTTVWTVPTGVTSILVSGIGPGGSGAGRNQSGTGPSGAGGGTGYWIMGVPTSTTPGSTIAVTIGTVGAGGVGCNCAAGGQAASSSSPTTIGSFITLNAGGGAIASSSPATATGTIAGVLVTGNSTAGGAGVDGGGAGGAGGTTSVWSCVGGAGGDASGGSGTTSTVGYGCGGGGGGGNAGTNGNGAAGGPSIVWFTLFSS